MTLSPLEHARITTHPTREAMLRRAPSVQAFWEQNNDLFREAWEEWDAAEGAEYTLDSSLYHPSLREAIERAWEDPAREGDVRELWEEVFPGVYRAQFFDPNQLELLRSYLERAAAARIPLRPPHGIVLNRSGAMLDPRSVGHLAAPMFQAFYRNLMDVYMRPIARLLFPDIVGYDTQTFGFSIAWQEDKDTSLRPHTDASAVTLNINLNLPGEDFSGSAVSFFDPVTRRVERLLFEPGIALIHHGSVPHASEPITRGERHNIVLWLYGEQGQVPPRGGHRQQIDPAERWSIPLTTPDRFAPF